MNSTVLSSPAKLNLFLKIQNKRPDGFHNIVTIFERINLADEISFCSTRDPSIRIQCNHPHVPIGRKNLVYKVAQALKDDFKIKHGAKIKINKRIPVAAGLAGGSSNGATALLGLNKIWKLGLNQAQLLNYARKIGSDVSFFIHDTSWAIGRNRGDHLKNLKIDTKLWHILVVPRTKMYSWKVYEGLKWGSKSKNPSNTNVLTKIDDNANILTRKLKKGNVLDIGAFMANDLEKVIIRLAPRLDNLKERLKSLNTKGVMISGSGPAVFGLTMTEKEAQLIKKELSKRYSQVFVVSTL